MNLYNIMRWVHLGSGASWLGEVVVINFVLVPALARMSKQRRLDVLYAVFPRIFKLASWLSATAVLSGLYLMVRKYGADWSVLFGTATGRGFLIGMTMALLLTTFHFILEPRLESAICVAAERPEDDLDEPIMRTLRLVPRVGLGVIGGIFVLMMYGARGL